MKWKRNATPPAFEIGVEIDSETLQVYLENCVLVSITLSWGIFEKLVLWIFLGHQKSKIASSMELVLLCFHLTAIDLITKENMIDKQNYAL